MGITENILHKILRKNGLIDSTAKIFSSVVKEDNTTMLGYGFSKTGKAVVGGMTILGIADGAKSQRDINDMGTTIGIRQATPSLMPYLSQQSNDRGMGDISAGVSGDLVFAMHKQRNRGYL